MFRNVVKENNPGLCRTAYCHFELLGKKESGQSSENTSQRVNMTNFVIRNGLILLQTCMNYVKCIANVLTWPQGHELVSAHGTQGQLSPWDHMIILKAVPGSYALFVIVCVWERECVCMCIFDSSH